MCSLHMYILHEQAGGQRARAEDQADNKLLQGARAQSRVRPRHMQQKRPRTGQAATPVTSNRKARVPPNIPAVWDVFAVNLDALLTHLSLMRAVWIICKRGLRSERALPPVLVDAGAV